MDITSETFALLSKFAEHKRKGVGLSQSRLARRAGVTLNTVKSLEAGKVGMLRLGELAQMLRVLDKTLTLVLAHLSQPPPKTNEEILSAFDQLLKKGKPNAFIRNAKDKKLAGVSWDALVGDALDASESLDKSQFSAAECAGHLCCGDDAPPMSWQLRLFHPQATAGIAHSGPARIPTTLREATNASRAGSLNDVPSES